LIASYGIMLFLQFTAVYLYEDKRYFATTLLVITTSMTVAVCITALRLLAIR
jgi:hypothetical protein